MHAELGTDPQIKYLYETPSVPGRDAEENDTSDEALATPENPLAGQPQTFWDIRAAMNFIMGGFGAGLIVMTYVLHLTTNLAESVMLNIYLVAAVIIAVGLFFVWLKIGRKLRAMYVILKPQTSWMSREVYAAGVLYILGLIDYYNPSMAFHTLVAVAAFIFLYCQARILHSAKGIPTWRAPQIPRMLVATGLYEGVGLVAIILTFEPESMGSIHPLAVVALVLAAINALIWRSYLMGAKQIGIGPLARAILLGVSTKVHLTAHFLPAAVFITFLTLPNRPAWLMAVAGLLVIIGGAYWKIVLITKACHQQGYALAKFPRRGSGRYAAPKLSNVS